MGVSSTQESLELGEIVTHHEAKNYTLSGVKKAVAAGEKSLWSQQTETEQKIVQTNVGEDTVRQTSKKLVIVSAEKIEKLEKNPPSDTSSYDEVEAYLPADDNSREIMLQLARE